jgi:hypothetical protein
LDFNKIFKNGITYINESEEKKIIESFQEKILLNNTKIDLNTVSKESKEILDNNL